MQPGEELIRLARQKAEAGRVPCEHPVHVRGGRGRGAVCVICDSPIGERVFEYELRFSLRSGGWSDGYSFHFDCHTAWAIECVKPP